MKKKRENDLREIHPKVEILIYLKKIGRNVDTPINRWFNSKDDELFCYLDSIPRSNAN